MDIEYTIDQDKIFFVLAESRSQKLKKKKKVLMLAESNLTKIIMDKINDSSGDC